MLWESVTFFSVMPPYFESQNETEKKKRLIRNDTFVVNSAKTDRVVRSY